MNAVVATGIAFAGATAIGADSTVTLGCAGAVIAATVGTSWASGRKWQRFLDRLDRFDDRLSAQEKKIESMARERRMDRDLPASSTTPIRTVSILLVDDDEKDRTLFKHGLGFGYQVDECSTLAQAVELSRKHRYDCIVIDLYLPDSEPENTVAAFLSENPVAVCMAISGTSSRDHINAAIKQGADAFISKGVYDRAYLSRMISQAINRKQIQ